MGVIMEVTDIDINIQMAARGCISGRLKEWPVLIYELKKYNYSIDPETSCLEVVKICREIVNGLSSV